MLVYGTPKESGAYQLAYLKFYKAKSWTRDKIEAWLRDNPQYSPQNQAEVSKILEARQMFKRKLEQTPLEKWRQSHVQ
jgi:hypothetical protein